MINVFADQYLYKINDYISENVNLTLFDASSGPTEIPEGTQALLIRTVTKINPETFPQFPDSLSFIGTGSAGTDHVDQPYLKNRDIAFTNAAGCNARSVGEYVAVSLLLWAEEQNMVLSNYTVGIVGAGHTGGKVKEILHRLNINTMLYDPPRAERDPNFTSATLEQVLECDILTFHTPLNYETSHPTYHWLNDGKLQNNSFELIINASRGGVVDEQALLAALKKQTIKNYILDVWENEPEFNDEVARHAYLKTPHIAGYSIQAKERATKMIIQAMDDHFNDSAALTEAHKNKSEKEAPASTFWSLADALTYYHPIEDYQTRLRMLIGRGKKEKAKGFNQIRTNHPLRNEFEYLNVPDAEIDKFPVLEKLRK